MDQQRRSSKFITGDSALLESFSFAQRGYHRGVPVLLTGENGTGKRTIAEALVSPVDSAALTELAPSQGGELPWDSVPRTGTVYFSRVEQLNGSEQWKLLSLIEGTGQAPPLPLRLIVGCDAGLSLRIREGSFLRRLYFALSRCEITIPPLRERREDVLLLTEYFLDSIAEREDVRPPRLDPGFFKPLERYLFPGNVRELANLVEKALLLGDWVRLTEKIARKTLRHHQISPWAPHLVEREDQMSRILWPPVLPSIGRAREQLLDEALSRFDGNQSRAARALGITPAAVNKYVNRQG